MPLVKAPEVQTPNKKTKGKGKRVVENEDEKLGKKRKVEAADEDEVVNEEDADVPEDVPEVEVRGSGYPSGTLRG